MYETEITEIEPESIIVGGTSNYEELENKPRINNVELAGNLSLDDLHIQEKDENYVHTDNNFTNENKEKLDSLNNYDDSGLKKDIEDLQLNKADKTNVYTKEESDNKYVQDIDYVHTDNNYTTEEKNKLASLENYDDTAIKESINTLETNKANKTDVYTKEEVDAKVSSVYRYRGSVASYDNLPTENITVGDAYNVLDTGANYAWTGDAWDKLSETVDLTPYALKEYVNEELNKKQNNLTAGKNITIENDVISSNVDPYELPIASTDTLGGVKVGANLNIDNNGTLNALDIPIYYVDGKQCTRDNPFVFEGKPKGIYCFVGGSWGADGIWYKGLNSDTKVDPSYYGFDHNIIIIINPITEDMPDGTVVALGLCDRYRYPYYYFKKNTTQSIYSSIRPDYGSKSGDRNHDMYLTNGGGDTLVNNLKCSKAPTEDTEYSNKKYVDDTVSGALGDISTVLSTLTTVSEVTE